MVEADPQDVTIGQHSPISEIRTAAFAALDSGVVYTLASIAVVQGLGLGVQFVLANWLEPAQFGVLRMVDTWLALLMVPAGLGMTSVVAKFVAETGDELARRQRLVTCLTVAAATASVVALVLMFVAPRVAPGDVGRYLATTSVVIIAMNISRVVLNFFQGLKQMREVALFNVAFALTGLAVILAPAWAYGLAGWCLGRVVYEALWVVAALWLARSWLAASPRLDAVPGLLGQGLAAAVALLLDRVAVSVDMLLMERLLGPGPHVGYFGLALLLVTAAGIVPAAFSQVLLPHVAERAHDPTAAMAYVRPQIRRVAIVLAMVVSVGALVVPLLTRALGDAYAAAMPVLWLALLAVPALGLANQYGTVLLALGRVYETAWVNLAGIAVSTLAISFLAGPWGAVGAAGSFVLASYARCGILVLMVKTHGSLAR